MRSQAHDHKSVFRRVRQANSVAITIVVITSLLAICARAASCDPEQAVGPPSTSGRILFDRGGELWVMDGDGQHQRPILKGGALATLSPDGIHIAYSNGKAIQALSLLDGCETAVDGALVSRPLDIGWSGDGKTLGYVGTSDRGRGLHVLSFPIRSASAKIFPDFNHVALSHDGRYALTIFGGVTRVDLLSGERTVLYKHDKSVSPWGATYSREGDIVAVLNSVLDHDGNDDPDTPDCRGTNTALRVLTEAGSVDIPFPDGFTSTLDYEFDFSPDGQQIAISFGADRCDYPGDIAAVYVFSLRDRKLRRISPKGRLAGRVKFSPDGRALVYTDFQGTGTTAIYRYELAAGQPRRLTTPRTDDYDYVMDWH
jgi:Tol biopolymer transport system component